MTESRIDDGDSAARNPTGLFLALGLAVATRFSLVNAQSFTMDEVSELSIAKEGLGRILSTVDGFPPLYHFLLHGWLEIFGTDAAARWLSVLFGVLAVLCVWNLARILVGLRGAGWSAVIFAVLPFHIWYSQEARAYSMVIFLAALTLWMFFRARSKNGWTDWAWFVGAGTAGMYTHYFFAVVVGTLAICLLIESRNGASSRRGWISFAVLGVLCVPDLVLLQNDLTYQTNRYYRKPTLGPAAFGYTYFSLVSGYTIGPSMRELHTMDASAALRSLLPWLPIVALAVGYPAWSLIRSPDQNKALRQLVILCLAPVILVGLLTYLGHLGYNVRYVSWVVVPVVIWLGAGIAHAVGRWEGKAALFLLVAVLALARWNRVTVDRYWEEDTRALATFLKEDEVATGRVMVSVGYMALPVSYYLGNEWTVGSAPDVSWEGDGLDDVVSAIRAGAQAEPGIWLAYSRSFHGDPAGLLRERLETVASRTERFAGIDLYLVDPSEM